MKLEGVSVQRDEKKAAVMKNFLISLIPKSRLRRLQDDLYYNHDEHLFYLMRTAEILCQVRVSYK